MSQMSYSGCGVSCGSVAKISCNVTGPSPAMLAAVGEQGYRVAERCLVGSGNDVHWMGGWLVVGPRCIAVAAANVVAGLCAAR
jgi:hypothetical protein